MVAQNDREIWIRCDTLHTPFQTQTDAVLHIVEGKIKQILASSELARICDSNVIYQPESIVAPGFIDLHVHGARGRDVMDGTLESLQTLSSSLASHGTTSFLATTLSAPDSDLEVALRGFNAHRQRVDGARALGIHLEGPYLNPARRGTHNASHIRRADLQAFRRLVQFSGNTIRKITLAPEMDDNLRVTREATALGIQISIGHSDATAEQAKAAVDNGAMVATHTFNAMRPLHQREPGILGVVLTDDRLYAEVIADGVHVHPLALRLLLRAKGVDRTLLVTDGVSAVDMPDGQYPLGNKTVVVRGNECRDSDGALAGSTLTLDRAVRNLVNWLDMPIHQAVATATTVPAQSLRITASKGILAPEADADLVFLDSELRVTKTMVGGRIVYSRN
jgi:N-acetylglucosamine-6-phosphate deacetylase